MSYDNTTIYASLNDTPWDPEIPLRCYNVKPNTTEYMLYLVPIYRVVGPIFLILCLVSFVGNAAILFTGVFIRKKQMTPTLMFSLSLAGADAVAAFAMGTGFFVNNILILNFHLKFYYGDCIVLTVEIVRLSAMVCSALHFMVLAINHFMGITKPLHYASRMTRATAYLCIAIMWILPGIIFVGIFALVPDESYRSPKGKCEIDEFAHRFWFRGFVSGLFFTPLIVMSVVYFLVFLEIGKHQKRLSNLDATNVKATKSERDEKRRMQSNTRALITTLIILLTYLIGWLPAVVNYVTVCKDCTVPLSISLCILLPVNIIVNLLILLKFLVDPIIYTARIQEIRTVMKYFCVKFRCQEATLNPRPFDRFDTNSGTGSFMTSLRYSTYRQRKESDTSKPSPQVSRRYSNQIQLKGHQHLDINAEPNGTSRRSSNGSLPREKKSYWPLPPPPLVEVNESLPSPSPEKRNSNQKGP